jgi:hypothetical protein
LAPASVQLAHCATNALPYRVEWSSPRGPVTFYGLTPDEAANDALGALSRGSVAPPAVRIPVTEPIGKSEWADAMRDFIADIDLDRAPVQRPALRVLRGGITR